MTLKTTQIVSFRMHARASILFIQEKATVLLLDYDDVDENIDYNKRAYYYTNHEILYDTFEIHY